MSWPKVKLESLVKISKGKKHSLSERPTSTRYIQIDDLRNDDLIKYTNDEAGVFVKKRDVIIAWDGANAGTIGYGLEGLIGSTLAKLSIVNPEVDTEYLARFLQSKFREIRDNCTGATIPHVSRAHLISLEIPFPSLKEQKRIAAILDKADTIRRKRQQAIQLADDFLRSVFLDMFGDPVTNPKGFPLSILSDFYISPKGGTKCGPFGSALKKHEYVEDGVPVWNMDNISLNGKFTDSPRLWITKSKYFDLEAYSVENGDVIISRAGTVGKMGVVRSKSEHSIISTNLIRVRFGEKLRPEYFVNLMNYCKGRVGRLKTGPDGAFTHMNTGILDKLEFPYPDIELQDKFIEIKEKVISSLEKSEKKDIDNLFNSLSQKAFAGEL